MSASSWLNIQSTYYDASNVHLTNEITIGSTVSMAFPFGTDLTTSDVRKVVRNAIMNNGVPRSSSALYLVLASAEVTWDGRTCHCGFTDVFVDGNTPLALGFASDIWQLSDDYNSCTCIPSWLEGPYGGSADNMVDSVASIITGVSVRALCLVAYAWEHWLTYLTYVAPRRIPDRQTRSARAGQGRTAPCRRYCALERSVCSRPL